MKGVVFPGNRKLEILDFPDPTPGPGEVVLEIKASGMCGSDLKFYRAVGGAASLGLGKVEGPLIAGHEPCGVVVAVGVAVHNDQRTARSRGIVSPKFSRPIDSLGATLPMGSRPGVSPRRWFMVLP